MEKRIIDQIDFFVENHKFISFKEYTSKLSESGFSANEIEVVFKNAKEIIEKQEIKMSKFYINEMMLAGIFLIIFGVLITIVTFLRILDLKAYFILAFGPILGGIGMIQYGRINEHKEKRKRKFDRF
jgi:hypothetical protein